MENEDEDDSCYRSICAHDIVIVIFWIGSWGVLETIIDKICCAGSINQRLLIYFFIVLLALFFNNLIVNSNKKKKQVK